MLSNSALYAVRAVGELAHLAPEQYAGAGVIAEKIGAPPNYLSKLLQTLTYHDIVCSRKGTGGGFRLVREPESINLYDVVEPIDRVSRLNNCFFKTRTCDHGGTCPVHHRWAPVREAFLKLLMESTVAEISESGVEIENVLVAEVPV